MTRNTVLEGAYPEIGAGGFSRYDGSVEFYGRINGLLKNHFRVLDIGAGRGAWHFDDKSDFRKELRTLKGKVAEVIGADVDEAVLENPTVDRAILIRLGQPLPFDDATFDLIIADYVFEHIADPAHFVSEVRRILKPGGWLCARTPNKWGYISIATRLIWNANHVAVLKRAQPGRKHIDVFETMFKLNTFGSIARYFDESRFRSFSYTYQAEPSYFFGYSFMLNAMRILDWMMPPLLRANLFIFLRKKELDAPG